MRRRKVCRCCTTACLTQRFSSRWYCDVCATKCLETWVREASKSHFGSSHFGSRCNFPRAQKPTATSLAPQNGATGGTLAHAHLPELQVLRYGAVLTP